MGGVKIAQPGTPDFDLGNRASGGAYKIVSQNLRDGSTHIQTIGGDVRRLEPFLRDDSRGEGDGGQLVAGAFVAALVKKNGSIETVGPTPTAKDRSSPLVEAGRICGGQLVKLSEKTALSFLLVGQVFHSNS